ncbi:MAG TPA: hypothetical protein VF696_00940 [Candidatus Paceibacterota bacterium]|jgi:hypothetical protein
MALLKTLAIMVAIGGLFIWGLNALPSMPKSESLAELPREALVAAPLPAAEDGMTSLEGIAIYDAAVEPRIPYIQYEYGEEGVRTKQLIFRNQPGCRQHAGDLPCALGPHQSGPEVPYGERIRVTGAIVGDQILVDSIEVI